MSHRWFFRPKGQPTAAVRTGIVKLELIAAFVLQQSRTAELELERGLVASSKAKACMSTQWLRYALRRSESSDDLASLQAVNSAFTGSGNDIRELIVALVKSRTFRFRAPAAGEVL